MVTVTLPPELEQTVIEWAQQQGTTPEQVALDELRLRFSPVPPPPVAEGSRTNFLALDAGWSGVVPQQEPG